MRRYSDVQVQRGRRLWRLRIKPHELAVSVVGGFGRAAGSAIALARRRYTGPEDCPDDEPLSFNYENEQKR